MSGPAVHTIFPTIHTIIPGKVKGKVHFRLIFILRKWWQKERGKGYIR